MKFLIALITMSLSSFTLFSQDKNESYTNYNKVTHLDGSSYVIASVENRTKMDIENKSLLFINTQNGETREIGFPKDGSIGKITQLKIDSLQLNKVIIEAYTINLNGDKSIDWYDPRQIIVCSTDGLEKTQITDDNFFTNNWEFNKLTGVMVITGYIDSNNNKKHDRGDKSQILLYDLKKMVLIKKI